MGAQTVLFLISRLVRMRRLVRLKYAPQVNTQLLTQQQHRLKVAPRVLKANNHSEEQSLLVRI